MKNDYNFVCVKFNFLPTGFVPKKGMQLKMSKHAIIMIKNSKNEYLQYYDERWKSYLFLNCKLSESFKEKNIVEEISEKLKISGNQLICEYMGDKIHKKYSESAKKEKEYHHYFYRIEIEEMPSRIQGKKFMIDNITYSWYSFEELKNDSRIQEVNSDIVGYIRELEDK